VSAVSAPPRPDAPPAATVANAVPAANAPPAPTLGGTIAVLGAKDSGSAGIAAHLGDTTGERIVSALAAGDAPALVLVVVDALCPIRPDDLEIAARLAARFPLAVVLVRAEKYGSAVAATASETARRLTSRRLPPPVLAARLTDPAAEADGADSVDGALSGSALVAEAARRACAPEEVRAAAAESLRGTAPATDLPQAAQFGAAAGGGAGAARPPASRASVLDWLSRIRTEVISARTQAVRQHAHAARLASGSAVSRRIRELSAEARAEIAAAPRRELPALVERIDAAADEVSSHILRNADSEAAYLRRQHLGSPGERERSPAPPPLALRFCAPPVHRGEEATLVFMGAAGGAGLGRLVAALLPGSALALACSIAAAVAGGLFLGALGVRARRTAALRAHLTALAAEGFAALRAEIDHAVSEILLHTESAITDAFAHDPGPRVRDIERRIHSLRTSGAPGTSTQAE